MAFVFPIVAASKDAVYLLGGHGSCVRCAASLLLRLLMAAISLFVLSVLTACADDSNVGAAGDTTHSGGSLTASLGEHRTDVPLAQREDMVLVPAGSFLFGGNPIYDTEPAHSIDLPEFHIDLTEVTNEQFSRFVEATGYRTEAERAGDAQNWLTVAGTGRDKYPVVLVTLRDAAAYCEAAGKRLPTEEEWEKAARGASGNLWPWGNSWDPALANTAASAPFGPTPVGAYPDGASPYGVLDMAGNVWEWTVSLYSAPTVGEPPFDANAFLGQYVLRGGSWRTVAPGTQSSYRKPAPPEYRRDSAGFRCAR